MGSRRGGARGGGGRRVPSSSTHQAIYCDSLKATRALHHKSSRDCDQLLEQAQVGGTRAPGHGLDSRLGHPGKRPLAHRRGRRVRRAAFDGHVSLEVLSAIVASPAAKRSIEFSTQVQWVVFSSTVSNLDTTQPAILCAGSPCTSLAGILPLRCARSRRPVVAGTLSQPCAILEPELSVF